PFLIMTRIITLCLILLTQTLNAQSKYDYTWVLGYDHYIVGPTGITNGGTIIDFNQTPYLMTHESLPTFEVLASISDQNGKLIAYTDGCRVANADHEIMVHGDTISPGYIYDHYCYGGAYPNFQGSLFLPLPGNSKRYALFHLRRVKHLFLGRDLLYSIVDTEGDNGKGDLINKNQVAWTDTLLNDYISAVKHANGRDWWVVMPRVYYNGYHVGLLTPEGVQYKGIQAIGKDSLPGYCCGQTAFSPDGSKYLKHIPQFGVEILDFDRCTGLFSNPVFIDLSADSSGSGGVVVSPNGRYLYVPATLQVYQYDLWASNIAASRQTVAVYESFLSPFPTPFNQAALGPDGKIYITSPNSNNILHVINNPDLPGSACDLVQHGVQLLTLTGFFAPNFPNYRLGPLKESICDSLPQDSTILSTNGIRTGQQYPMLLYPNPASESFTLLKMSDIDERSGSFSLYGPSGALLCTKNIRQTDRSIEIKITDFPAGLYYWEIVWDSGPHESGKVQRL
ncbi:hypothetical protein, partial [Runella sp.]|uniref:hypothetical protein n=1 Tax=Runella sp. TaxID=1960881 RepID=UPI003016E148